MLIEGSNVTGHKKNVSILTIGVHGNEIYAGAICALEILKAQKEGKLEGDVVLQLGNLNAIRGYLNAYDPNIYYTERSGWRSTYGNELGIEQIKLDDGSIVDVKNDMNRVPKTSLCIPRGLSPNTDRAQDIIWTARAVDNGLLPNASGTLEKSKQTLDIGFILHPHTSRSPNGITNLSLPRKTREALKDGQLGKPFIHTPQYMMNIIQWVGDGLGGTDNFTMTRLITEEINSAPLVVTAELGNHEDIKTPHAPSLIDTSKLFTAGLLETSGMVEKSYLKNAYNLAAHPHSFNYYKAQHRGLKFFELDGFDKLETGDMIYPARLMNHAERQNLSLLEISRSVIVVDKAGKAEVIDMDTARKDPEKIRNADKAYHQLWPFELEHIPKGETLFLGIKDDGQAKELKAQKPFYTIFPWFMRQFMPAQYDPLIHDDLRLYNTADSKDIIELPEKKKSAQPNSTTPQKPSPKQG